MAQLKRPHTEEQSRAELASTIVSRRTAMLMSWAFVTMIASVPLTQGIAELWNGRRLGVLALFDPVTETARLIGRGRWEPAFASLRIMFRPEHLHNFERSVETSSIFKAATQPRLQQLLTGQLGFGNDKVTVGRDGWLYYEPGLDYLTGPSLTDASHLRVLAKKAIDKQVDMDPQPDPRPAILDFSQQCRARGIHLIVLPIPDKSMLQPTQLTRRIVDDGVVPNNRGYRDLLGELAAAGVDVVDVTPARYSSKEQLYLRQDTHWTPSFMEASARQVAEHIMTKGWLGEPTTRFQPQLQSQAVSNTGDLTAMLGLPADQSLYRPERIEIHRVLQPSNGEDVKPDSNSEVLLLGDSFTNIYSLDSMHWGRSAGFGEHLAQALQCPIDVIALNGTGASGTRAELANPANQDRLACKTVIVWEFAIRDLAVEMWRKINLPSISEKCTARPAGSLVTRGQPVAPIQPNRGIVASDNSRSFRPKTKAAPSRPIEPTKPAESATTLIVIGRVLKTSKIPAPFSAPYGDCLATIKFTVEQVASGSYSDPEIITVHWAMKENKWLPPAEFAIGDRYRLRLIRFRDAEETVRRTQRVDQLDDYDHIPYYALEEVKLP